MAEYTPKKPKGKTKPYKYTGSSAVQMTPGLSFGGAPSVVPDWTGNFGQRSTPDYPTGAFDQVSGIRDGGTLFDAAKGAGFMDTSGINQFQFGKPTLANSPSFGVTAPLPVDTSKPFSFADWGSKNKDLINGGVGIANSLANAYFGWKNLGLAKDQFKFQQESWNKNFANQVTTTNNQLEEKARQRYNASPTTNISPEEYMAKHGVK